MPINPKRRRWCPFFPPSWLRENHLFPPSPPFPQEWAAHLSIKRGGGGGRKKGGLDRVRKTHKAEMGRKRWVKIFLPSSLSFGVGYRPRKKKKLLLEAPKAGNFPFIGGGFLLSSFPLAQPELLWARQRGCLFLTLSGSRRMGELRWICGERPWHKRAISGAEPRKSV